MQALRVGPMAQRRPVPSSAPGLRAGPARRLAIGRVPLAVRASTGFARPPGEEAPSSSGSSGAGGPAGPGGRGLLGPFLSVPATVMAKGGGGDMGSGSVLGAVLERTRIEIVMPTPPQQAPRLDDGDDGGGIGKNNHNGGGGGDGGGGDDDDFFGGEEGDGEGGDGSGGGGGGLGLSLFRVSIPELFDRAALAAVLQEWFKTVADLPLFIRRSVEMGLFSSAQLVRFLAVDVRPGAARAVSRALPTAAAREFVGRLMADPAFLQKLAVEQVLAFSASMLHEWRVRGDAFRSELDLALINSMGLAAAVGAATWITAPSRAYGAVHKFPWQRMLAGLPGCVFDASGPLRAFSPAARVGGFFASAAQLSAVGAAAGAATAAAGGAAVAARRRADPGFEPSVPVPEVGRSSGGLGAFFALNANARYQLLGGLDRYLFGHAAALWSYVAATGLARVAGVAAGEMSRAWWQGLATEEHPSHAQRKQRVRKVKRRVVKRPAGGAPLPAAAAAAGAGAVGAAATAAAAGAEPAAAQGSAEQGGVPQPAGAVDRDEAVALLLASHNSQQAAFAALAAGVRRPAGGSGAGAQPGAARGRAAGSASADAAAEEGAPRGAAVPSGDAPPTTSAPEARGAAAAAAEAAAEAEEGSVEGGVQSRLQEAPAMMGSPDQLAGYARAESFSASAMGEALRDAVSEAAASEAVA